ncbi:sensor histidine kinase [Nocardioides sediminis]|uniref:sensor histidine kinase n=1 Tax=Nocardioides sediminis TaxID=433648 RepID=UPI000D31D330|nr:sensor histidine kinase [Nocardioides sediminis]
MTSLRAVQRPLWWRVVAVNLVIFAVGTAALVLSPATVSARPLASEVVVLLLGLSVMTVANALVVRSMVRPFDQLVHRLDHELSADPIELLPVDDDGIAGRVAGAVNDLLGRIEREQRAAGASALAGQEGERARIAQELHDGVGQSLTAILLEAGRLAGSEHVAPGDVARIRDVARDSLDEVRRVARQLRPHVLEDLGLRSALSALTTDLFEHSGTHARRTVSPALPDLDETVELVVFRVAQEALTNVARHAGASTVELRLTPRGEDVVLEVADDGRGVPRGAAGTGLRGMRERAGLVGGTVDVARGEGGGTVVTLVVPVVPR